MTIAAARGVRSDRARSGEPSSHFPAALRATTAGLDAFLLVADALAVIRTFDTDLGAFVTDMLAVRGVDEHEIR